jgi:hypothetical protein
MTAKRLKHEDPVREVNQAESNDDNNYMDGYMMSFLSCQVLTNVCKINLYNTTTATHTQTLTTSISHVLSMKCINSICLYACMCVCVHIYIKFVLHYE